MKGLASKPASATQSNSPFRSRGSKNSVIQTKLQVNKPGDAHEVEADQAAEKLVVQTKSDGKSQAKPPAISQTITPLQRKEEESVSVDQSVMSGEPISVKEDIFIQKKNDFQMKSGNIVQNKQETQVKEDDSSQEKEDVQEKEELVQAKEQTIETTNPIAVSPIDQKLSNSKVGVSKDNLGGMKQSALANIPNSNSEKGLSPEKKVAKQKNKTAVVVNKQEDNRLETEAFNEKENGSEKTNGQQKQSIESFIEIVTKEISVKTSTNALKENQNVTLPTNPNAEGNEKKNHTLINSGTANQLTENKENDNLTNLDKADDPLDASMRSSVRYNKELTVEQKAYFKWDLVLKTFRALPVHTKVSDYYLQQWARKQLSLGWSLGQAVPDLESFRAVYGEPQVYQVTKKLVPTLYVYEYAGNKSAVRSELLNKQDYNGFWIYVDSITGKKSVLQQRNSFAKYYDTHPIGPADVQLVFKLLEIKGVKQPGNTITVMKESSTFRKAVERAQDLLFPGTVKGYGLLTPPTLEAIKTSLKKAHVEKEKKFAEIGGKITFKEVNNLTGLAKDPEGFSSRTGEWQNGGVNLRSMPFTPEDPTIKGNPVSLSVVKTSIIEHLVFGTRMTILKETVVGSNGKHPGWYWVMTETGKEGYVAKHLVQTKLPAPDVRYHLVGEGETLLGIARKYYSPTSEDRVGIVESSGEFRNYVLELARYNQNWRGDEAGAVFEAGFNPNDPQSWKHTTVRKGLRMWIPSSTEMYYLIHKRPESQKFDNTNWEEDGGQWIIDNSPVTMLINSYLDWWATIPQEQREKGVQKYYRQQLALYKRMQADWSWLDKYIGPITPLIPGGGAVIGVSLIYDLYIAFNIGYFDFLSKSDPKMLVLSAERSLRNLTQLEHYKGLVFGFFEGIYDWGKDLMDSFVAIGKAIGSMTDLLTDPETYKKIGEFAGNALEYVVSNEDEVKKTLEDLNVVDIIVGLIGGMRSILQTKGKEMGQGAAQALMKFAGGSPYEQGFSIGKLIGFLVPEIVLAVASEGIWLAVKGALKSMQLVTKILKPILKGIEVGLDLLKSAASAAKNVVKFIGDFIKGVLSKTKKGASKFWEKMEELFEGFHRFLKNKYDDALTTNKAGNVDVDEYADMHKKRLKEDFEKNPDVKKGDPDYNETLGAAIKAKAIVEMNDALNPSPPVIEVVSFLNATIDLLGGKKFKYERNVLGNHHYRIYFNPTIENDYTEGVYGDKERDFDPRKDKRFESIWREERMGSRSSDIKKAQEEATSILKAENKSFIENPRRPKKSLGEPDLDFKIDGPPPYKWADIKSPVDSKYRNLDLQAKEIGENIRYQKAGSDDILHIVDLNKLPLAERNIFMKRVVEEAGSSKGIKFID